MFDFSSVKKIHFLGVGGVSMSSLARFFHRSGYCVSGSDREYSDTLVSLNEEGISVWPGFEPALIGNPDLVVFSSAIPPFDPELVYLKSSGFTVLERHAFLPYLAALFGYTVAIAGTHGKTTVTSMCALIMKTASLSFYAHIGGASKNLGSFYFSGNDFLLMEACEYRRSMLSVSPFVAAVLNAEVDHPDTYRDKSDVFDAFDDFLASSKGLKIVNGDCEYYRLRQRHLSPVTFGFSPDCEFRGVDVKQFENGCFGCRITHLGILLTDIKLKVPGKCNLTDALAAAAICASIGVSGEYIKAGLDNFDGVYRRFDYCGKFLSASVYTDYAHHPTEISETLYTASLLEKNKLIVVFQPHTYSRTARLKKEFVSALAACDKLIIVKEYAARETPSDGMSALALFRECSNREKYYADNLVDAAALLHKKTAPNDLILIVGAGNVVNLAKLLVT